MRVFSLVFLAVLLFSSCKKEVREEVNYDQVLYGLNNVVVYSSSAEKTRQKTPGQYISILYGDLFGTRISNNELNNLNLLSIANGDKGMANELILSHYLNSPEIELPTDQEMRDDIGAFVEACYVRFYKRYPTPYEKLYLTNLIDEDQGITVQLVYTTFILSNEYYFY